MIRGIKSQFWEVPLKVTSLPGGIPSCTGAALTQTSRAAMWHKDGVRSQVTSRPAGDSIKGCRGMAELHLVEGSFSSFFSAPSYHLLLSLLSLLSLFLPSSPSPFPLSSYSFFFLSDVFLPRSQETFFFQVSDVILEMSSSSGPLFFPYGWFLFRLE